MAYFMAFISESIPVAVALTLLLVANRIEACNILPKGLVTVETLGHVNVICSKKRALDPGQNAFHVCSISGSSSRACRR